MRLIWASFGILALILGVIGIVTPLLPTVPFLLLAAFCFSKSSERLHHWLITHPVLGPPIENWNRSGAISKKSKQLATGSMLAVFVISLVIGLAPLILIIQGAVLCCVAIFIWSRPSA